MERIRPGYSLKRHNTMKRSHKIIAAAASTLALALAIPAIASAHGFGMMGGFGLTAEERVKAQTEIFQRHAEMLGITVDEAKQYWAEGKNVLEIAEAKGITQEQLREKMQAYRKQEQKERFHELVSAGVITQAQADARIATMESRSVQLGSGKGSRGGHRGMGGMMGGF
jgi:hypothetical protein